MGVFFLVNGLFVSGDNYTDFIIRCMFLCNKQSALWVFLVKYQVAMLTNMIQLYCVI